MSDLQFMWFFKNSFIFFFKCIKGYDSLFINLDTCSQCNVRLFVTNLESSWNIFVKNLYFIRFLVNSFCSRLFVNRLTKYSWWNLEHFFCIKISELRWDSSQMKFMGKWLRELQQNSPFMTNPSSKIHILTLLTVPLG